MLLRRLYEWPARNMTSAFEELESMKRQMDLLTQGLTRGLLREPTSGVFPLVNVTEDKNNYYIRAELPGLKADDIDISVTVDTLSISGEKRLPVEEENARYHRSEREGGKFSRIISLPSPVNTGKVEAGSADGILTVVLPKAEEAKPKQISVKVS